MEQLFPQKPRYQLQIPKFLTKEQNRNVFVNWVAGLLGGLSSITIFSPFDLARTRHIILATTTSYGVVQYKGFLQTLSKIYSDEGLRGLYKGYGAAAVTVPIFHSLYFAIFYRTKNYLNNKWVSEKQPILTDVLASLYTGIVCNTLTNPLWVVRTRIQSQYLHREDSIPKYTGLVSGLRKMWKDEGYKSLFKGLMASYLGLTHCVILFPLYEKLKRYIADYKGELTNTDILLASNISKFVAMTLTYPHVVIRARLQDCRTPRLQYDGHSKSDNNNATIASIFKSTYQKEGLRGLYSGLRIDLIRVLPANSVTFLVFEVVKKTMEEALVCREQ